MGELKERIKKSAQEEVPEGWKTSWEWAEEEEVTRSTVNKLLFSLVRSGEMEKKKFKVLCDNRVIAIPHYKLKE